MNEWFASLDLAPWAPVAAAYLFGIATGWLIWGGRPAVDNGLENGHLEAAEESQRESESTDDTAEKAASDANPEEVKEAAKALFSSKPKTEPETKDLKDSNGNATDNGVNGDPAPDSMKLGALESELRKAHQLLAEANEENADYAEHLNELDRALKRANDRIKMVIKAVKKAKPGA